MSKFNAPTAHDLLSCVNADETREAVVRFEFTVGLLATARLADVVAYGRSLGLHIRVHKGGGWLTRHGYIRAVGPWPSLARFLRRLADESE